VGVSAQVSLFQAPPAARTATSLAARSLAFMPGTPMIWVNPRPAAIIRGRRSHRSASISTSRLSCCEVRVGSPDCCCCAKAAAAGAASTAARAAVNTSARFMTRRYQFLTRCHQTGQVIHTTR